MASVETEEYPLSELEFLVKLEILVNIETNIKNPPYYEKVIIKDIRKWGKKYYLDLGGASIWCHYINKIEAVDPKYRNLVALVTCQ